MVVAKTLAFYCTVTITAIKSVIVQAAGNLIQSVIFDDSLWRHHNLPLHLWWRHQNLRLNVWWRHQNLQLNLWWRHQLGLTSYLPNIFGQSSSTEAEAAGQKNRTFGGPRFRRNVAALADADAQVVDGVSVAHVGLVVDQTGSKNRVKRRFWKSRSVKTTMILIELAPRHSA